MDIEQKYEIIEHGGTSIVEKRVCFDRSNKYLFCCVGNAVNVYSVETTECVAKLIHDSNLIAVFINPQNFLQILTCTEDGVIAQWDYEDAVQVKSFQIKQRISSFFVCQDASILGFVVKVVKDEVHCLCEIRKESNEIRTKELLRPAPKCSKKISIHPKGHFVVVVDRTSMKIKLNDDGGKQINHTLKGFEKTHFTCVECHPSKDCLATGDTMGRIILWYKFLQNQPVQTIFHWHSTEIVDLVFPSHGSSMYSAGRESVVVKWTLESSSKQETKDFLPRLNGQINNLSSSDDNSLIAVSLDDNSIVLASGRLELTKTVQGFVRSIWRQPCISGSAGYQYDLLPLGLRYDHELVGSQTVRGCLITNGTPGRVQFYDLEREKQVLNLDVVGRNLPPVENNKILPYSEVVQMAANNKWLATVDYRPDDSYTVDFCLKFWRFDDVACTFKLITAVEHPHKRIVTSMEFHPDSDSLVTTSLDCTFKVWQPEDLDDIYEKKLVWICDRSGDYRNLPAYCCAFSRVGSVLAVSFGQTVTFWKFDENQLIFSLIVAEKPNLARNIKFGVADDETSLLCVLSSKHLAVWDVDAQVVLWTVDSTVTSVCLDPVSGLLAAFTSKQINVYRFSSHRSILSIDYDASAVCASCFYPNTDESIAISTVNLYFMTADQKLMRVCTKSQADSYRNKKLSEKSINSSTTRLANFLMDNKFVKNENSSDTDRLVDQKSNLELLNAPAHTLPGLDVLGPNFIESCLQPKRKFEPKIEPMEVDRKFSQMKQIQDPLSIDIDRKNHLKTFVKCDFSDLSSYFSTL